MYNVCSIFSQVLKLFSRGDFEKAVQEHKAERHARVPQGTRKLHEAALQFVDALRQPYAEIV
jgi:hypothetical protein